MKNQKGFTLIELLVVIAIIGLLSTLAVVSLNNARQKSRDARRVSDIKQVQTALELYFNDKDGYPVASAITLGSSSYDTLSGTGGFAANVSGTEYMAKVPANPSPGGANYQYTSAGATYSIGFTLESAIPSLGTGTSCTASPSGIACT